MKIARCGNPRQFDSSDLQINWVVSRKCNYSCSYCTVKNNAAPISDRSVIDRVAAEVKKIAIRNIHVVLTGGEPTIDPNYFYILDALLAAADPISSFRITTITNLGMPGGYFKELAGKYSAYNHCLRFCVSYHYEHADLNRFIENVEIIGGLGFEVKAQLLMHPIFMPDMRKIFDRLRQLRMKNIKIEPKVVRENFGTLPDKRYSRDDMAWIKQNYQLVSEQKNIAMDCILKNGEITRKLYSANELIAMKMNKFKGMLCNAGVNMISIDEKGDVSGAVCFRGDTSRYKINIIRDDNPFSKVSGPVVCPFKSCGCLADLEIPKYLPETSRRRISEKVKTFWRGLP